MENIIDNLIICGNTNPIASALHSTEKRFHIDHPLVFAFFYFFFYSRTKLFRFFSLSLSLPANYLSQLDFDCLHCVWCVWNGKLARAPAIKRYSNSYRFFLLFNFRVFAWQFIMIQLILRKMIRAIDECPF